MYIAIDIGTYETKIEIVYIFKDIVTPNLLT